VPRQSSSGRSGGAFQPQTDHGRATRSAADAQRVIPNYQHKSELRHEDH
jgi:hypothetical protein